MTTYARDRPNTVSIALAHVLSKLRAAKMSRKQSVLPDKTFQIESGIALCNPFATKPTPGSNRNERCRGTKLAGYQVCPFRLQANMFDRLGRRASHVNTADDPEGPVVLTMR
jgi:hypothetical protein